MSKPIYIVSDSDRAIWEQDKVNYAVSEREEREQMDWTGLDCTGLHWAVLGCTVLAHPGRERGKRKSWNECKQ